MTDDLLNCGFSQPDPRRAGNVTMTGRSKPTGSDVKAKLADVDRAGLIGGMRCSSRTASNDVRGSSHPHPSSSLETVPRREGHALPAPLLRLLSGAVMVQFSRHPGRLRSPLLHAEVCLRADRSLASG